MTTNLLKNAIAELESKPWIVRHHLQISVFYPYRVAWAFPVGQGMVPEAWQLRVVGAGLQPQDYSLADALIQPRRPNAIPRAEVAIADGKLVAQWNKHDKSFGRVMLISDSMPRLIGCFRIENDDGRAFWGLIYEPCDRVAVAA